MLGLFLFIYLNKYLYLLYLYLFIYLNTLLGTLSYIVPTTTSCSTHYCMSLLSEKVVTQKVVYRSKVTHVIIEAGIHICQSDIKVRDLFHCTLLLPGGMLSILWNINQLMLLLISPTFTQYIQNHLD